MKLEVETKLPLRVVQNRMFASEAEVRPAYQQKQRGHAGAGHHASTGSGAHRHSL